MGVPTSRGGNGEIRFPSPHALGRPTPGLARAKPFRTTVDVLFPGRLGTATVELGGG